MTPVRKSHSTDPEYHPPFPEHRPGIPNLLRFALQQTTCTTDLFDLEGIRVKFEQDEQHARSRILSLGTVGDLVNASRSLFGDWIDPKDEFDYLPTHF